MVKNYEKDFRKKIEEILSPDFYPPLPMLPDTSPF